MTLKDIQRYSDYYSSGVNPDFTIRRRKERVIVMIPVIDMHCDTISAIHDRRLGKETIGLRDNRLHIDLERMRSAAYMCQNFAFFTYLKNWEEEGDLERYGETEVRKHFETPYDYVQSLSETLDQEFACNGDLIRQARSGTEIEENFRKGLMSGIKTVEEGAVYEGDPKCLKALYDQGVRMTTLTWNFENDLAYPNRVDFRTGKVIPDTEHGLKPKGKEMAEYCRELGIIMDISHLNDGGILDLFDLYGNQTPIVASHSNAREITGHPRNLTDEMLKKLARCGGVTGINFCAAFLNDRNDNFSKVDDMIRHIKHIENVAGIDAIGLGGDMDGIENNIEFEHCGGMQKLAQALEKAGYNQDKIEKIFYRNVLRVYKEVLG